MHWRYGLSLFLLILPTLFPLLRAQTTQGLITGRVLDARSAQGLPARLTITHAAPADSPFTTLANSAGDYAAFLLPPGRYRVRVDHPNYQSQEIQELDLRIGGRLDLTFLLRSLSDVWEQGLYRSALLPDRQGVLTFFGPDMDMTRSLQVQRARSEAGDFEPGLSTVLRNEDLRDLPLSGRDLYAAIVTQPGVTADAGTGRGLGVSVSGLRPSVSNYLLDGVENNNHLLTGPLVAVAPEAIGEYRLTLNNYSAEYGRGAGFLANAVTQSGSPDAWHGLAYLNLKHDSLNANSFARNRAGLPRADLAEAQSGFRAGGPLHRKSLLGSLALERLANRGEADPQEVILPTTLFEQFTAPNSLARRLLRDFPAPAFTAGNLPIGRTSLTPPTGLTRWFSLARLDYSPARSTRKWYGRSLLNRLTRPDFIWTPYEAFRSPLTQDTDSLALGTQGSLRPTLVYEARFAASRDSIGWDRARPDIPTLFEGLAGTILPGSPAFYAYRNRSRTTEAIANLGGLRGSHVWKIGGAALFRRISGSLTAGRDGLYLFNDILDFTLDRPASVLSARDLRTQRLPDFERRWTERQASFFLQDAWRLRPNLVLNLGLRYENFGSPITEDGARVYSPDANNLAARAGFSYALSSSTVLRGAYGLFYDRPFDNLWQNTRNNSFTLAQTVLPPSGFNYLQPISQLSGPSFDTGFPDFTRIDPDLRTAYAQNWFLGARHLLSESWALELNLSGALGRKLITTDLLNRGRADDPTQRQIIYRANQGASNYQALSLVSRYRSRRGSAQIAYTWSHAIDNQSEPLAGDFFNLTFTRAPGSDESRPRALFSRPGDSRIDRGSADFDQRHNLVFYSTWNLPAAPRLRRLTRDWTLGQMAALRSGFPFSVYANSVSRADLRPNVDPLLARDAPGGRQLLNAAAFALPPEGRPGNLGRNTFRAPGFSNLDLSLLRRLRLSERMVLTVRADFYNVLNHTNLDAPESLLGSPDFGFAPFGRRGRNPGFPALVPLSETPRQTQFILRFDF